MKKLSFIPLLIFLLVHIQCGGGGDRTYSGTTPVSIKIIEVTGETGSGADQLSGAVKTVDLSSAVADGEGSGRQLSLCRFTITGPGMADMEQDVDVTGKDSISETFNVPSGVSRQFLIQMFVEDNDTVIYQAMRDGVNLEGVPVDLEIKPEFEDAYFEAPSFSGINSLENSESKSVMLNWNPATDNVTSPERIQYQVYLSNESLSGRDDVNCDNLDEIYILGKGLLGGDSLVTINGDSGLMSYEYEGTLPASATSSNGILNTGVTYYFIVEAQDEWGNVDRKCVESEPVIVYQLAVNTVGSGRVITEPKGIDCGIKCSEDFLTKKEITLTAEAYEGATFDGWSGNDQCEGTGDCKLTLSNNESIIANFCESKTYYNDVDGDGYGDPATVIYSCTDLDQDIYVANGDDCDDIDPTINPDATEVCDDEIDNDCDGATDLSDTNCQTCVPGATQACNTGQQGVCAAGTETCVALGFWGTCLQDVQPSAEICTDSVDNDCDGTTDLLDSDCQECIPGAMQICDTGLLGVCAPGTETCGANGFWEVCTQDVESSIEICDDNMDNDCDGTVDLADTDCQECIPEATQICNTGLLGACTAGTEMCGANGFWGECLQNLQSSDEICTDSIDNDCDGAIDLADTECQECTPGAEQSCTTGLPGVCAPGTETCGANGFWEACVQDIQSSAEKCSDNVDNDCDGAVDLSDTDCQECTPGAEQSCSTGQQGVCAAGTETCGANGFWEACVQDIQSSAEKCSDNVDNDCDGAVDLSDTDCQECTPGATQSCDTGQQGVCAAGTETCSTNGFWGSCARNVNPSAENCSDSVDNDCDGEVDLADTDCQECTPGATQSCNTGQQGVCAAGTETCSANGFWGSCARNVNPSAEICDNEDNDCDGSTDENVIIVIGDNDGYGYGSSQVPDNGTLPMAPSNQQYCFDPSFSGLCNHNNRSSCEKDTANNCDWVDWQFNNQESTESGASDGAQYTDIVRYGPSFTFTLNFSPLLNLGQAWFQLDVSGIQTDIWGASSITIDGTNHTSMLPTEQGVFGSSVRTRLLNQNSVLDGSVTVSFQGGTVNGGDAIAFDYFELGMTCEP